MKSIPQDKFKIFGPIGYAKNYSKGKRPLYISTSCITFAHSTWTRIFGKFYWKKNKGYKDYYEKL